MNRRSGVFMLMLAVLFGGTSLGQEPTATRGQAPRMTSDDSPNGISKARNYHSGEESSDWQTFFPRGFDLSIDLPAEPVPITFSPPPSAKKWVKTGKSVMCVTKRLAIVVVKATITGDCGRFSTDLVSETTTQAGTHLVLEKLNDHRFSFTGSSPRQGQLSYVQGLGECAGTEVWVVYTFRGKGDPQAGADAQRVLDSVRTD